MIQRLFREPNFRCAATEENGVRRVWLTQGGSAEIIEKRLTDDGWIVHAVKPYDFARWRRRSLKLSATIKSEVDKGKGPKFNEYHWRKLKMHLFELFDGKCAYCEAKPGNVTTGHVEHYRPKGRVKDDAEHGGYYWLAFEATNLLPACPACNSANGKLDRFPVVPGTRAVSDAGIPHERPLLLNPYGDDNPLDHLRFMRTGQVEGTTDIGRASADIYDLKRKGLREARFEAMDNLESRVKTLLALADFPAQWLEIVADVRKGHRQYSAALLIHLDRIMRDEERRAAAARAVLQIAHDDADKQS